MKILGILFGIILFITSCKTVEERIVYKDRLIKEREIVKELIGNNKPNLDNYIISSKHFPSDSQGFRVKYLILHYTVSDYPTSIRILTKKQVSSHYLVNDSDNDTIDLLVLEEKRAYHAGISYWNKDQKLNDTSIGIEIVNSGFKMVNGKMEFAPFPDFQIKKVAELAQDIVKRYNIPATNVLAHSDIAPQRKQDPGPMFPWKKLYEEYQIGSWYIESDKEIFSFMYDDSLHNDSAFIKKVQDDLNKFGYEIQSTGFWDAQTKTVIQAFQFHYRPSNYDGILDKETWAILQALNKRYRK